MRNFKSFLEEKTLTPAEKKKREEIAKAMERENPGMPMAKKMAIATATAKKVAEDDDTRMGTITVKTDAERQKRAQMYRDKKAKPMPEEVDLDEAAKTNLDDYYMDVAKAFKKENPKLKLSGLGWTKKGMIAVKDMNGDEWEYNPRTRKLTLMTEATINIGDVEEARRSSYEVFRSAQAKERNKKYTPPTQAEIDADRKKDEKGKPRPSISTKSINKKMYEAKLSSEQRDRLDDLIYDLRYLTMPHNGLGADKVKHGIYKQTKKDAALRNRNTYREEVELDEGAPKIKPDFLKVQREKDRAHDAAMGRTPTGRKKVMTSTQKSMAFMRKEEVELDEDISKMSHSRLKWHMNTGVPHGRYTKDEMKKERDRRLKTGEGEAYRKAKPMLEEVELDEKGLWDNIWAKRRAGKKMRKPGSKGAPTDADFKRSQEEK